ncbi:hypothetical protein C8J98_10217 [Luteibacter sp. OK325]|uniref:hypothetical protein n=1 Tax=Luteibacter sp. OK325 TaxID=2135670 RepID=UPI000D37DE0F|nr:hypothetical protein [Luteibacter sp. OK325]PTR33832.1 hypothetical protein C8J98_10217 [Luteibacter sp. OK325]
MIAAVSAAMVRRYPAPWTALTFAAVPVLLRCVSSHVGGALLLCVGHDGFRSTLVVGAAVFALSFVGFLKYSSRAELLAYALWVVTFLSVAVLGIVMFEAFGPPEQWSGSLSLPAMVVMSCCAGVISGAVLRFTLFCRSRFSGDGC